MGAVKNLQSHLKPGKVYRREELSRWSTSIDRHLKELVDSGVLRKLSAGLYYSPKHTAFGEAPADDQELVSAFLKSSQFLLTSRNAYNSLGVGSTQLYNETVVYNHKRHGHFSLGGRSFDFRVKPSFPKVASREFLLVDLVSNVDRLAEEKEGVLDRVRKLAEEFDRKALLRAVRDYGSERSKKFFGSLFGEEATHGR